LRLRPTLVVASAVVLAAGLSSVAVATPSQTKASSGSSSASAQAAAPGFLVPVSARGKNVPAQSVLRGDSSMVALRPAVLPAQASGQRLSFDVGNRTVTGTIDRIEHVDGATAWTGPLDVENGSFTVSQSGSTYRALVLYPGKRFAVTQADGNDLYWLTDVDPEPIPPGTDAETHEDHAADGAGDIPWTDDVQSPAPVQTERRKKRKVKISVLFAYDKAAKAEAGGKAGLKAAVAQVVADTNTSLKNSGVKAKIKSRGIIRAKGKTAKQLETTYQRLFHPFDRNFDNVRKAQKKRKADLTHLFVGGEDQAYCGFGSLPYTPKTARAYMSVSVSSLSCLPYLTVTHELGHNLGADHDKYPGVSHGSRVKYAYGYVDVANRFNTIMAYPQACYYARVNCTRVPFYSTPKKTFNGIPTGGKKQNNAKVIKKMVRKVSNYNGRW
jgi:hypothetical protein